jgi:hypothetical protein
LCFALVAFAFAQEAEVEQKAVATEETQVIVQQNPVIETQVKLINNTIIACIIYYIEDQDK